MIPRTAIKRAVPCLLSLAILVAVFGASLVMAAPSSAGELGVGPSTGDKTDQMERPSDMEQQIPEDIRAGAPNDLQVIRGLEDLNRQSGPIEVPTPENEAVELQMPEEEEVNECGPTRDPFEASAGSSGLSDEDAATIAELQGRAGGALSKTCGEAQMAIVSNSLALVGDFVKPSPASVPMVFLHVTEIVGAVIFLNPALGTAGGDLLADITGAGEADPEEAVRRAEERVEEAYERAEDAIAEEAEAKDKGKGNTDQAEADRSKALNEFVDALEEREKVKEAAAAGDQIEPDGLDPEDEMIWDAHFTHLAGTEWEQNSTVDSLVEKPAYRSDPRAANPGPEDQEQGTIRPNGVGTGVVDPDTPDTVSSATPTFDCGIVEELVARSQPGSLDPEVTNPNPEDDPEPDEEVFLPVNAGPCKVCSLGSDELEPGGTLRVHVANERDVHKNRL